MLQRRNICSIGAISLNVLRGQGFWCPGLSAAGGARPEDMGHKGEGSALTTLIWKENMILTILSYIC